MTQDTNNYWEQLERLEKLIRASELKAGVIFSFHSLILGLYVDRIENFQELLTSNKLFLIFAILWLISVMISIYYCFRCFKPNMELKYDNNVFFFRNAARKFNSVKDYTKELTRICGSEKEIITLLSQQIHAESVIIDKKFLNVNKAILFFVISFLFLIIKMTFWVFLEVF